MKHDYLAAVSRKPVGKVILYEEGGKLQAVRLEDGQASEWVCEPEPDDVLRRDVFLAVVSEIVPTLKACFVDIGTSQPAFLPLSETPPSLKPGQPLIVQIRRLTPPEKGSIVTTRIQLAGPYAVFFCDRPAKKRSLLNRLPAATQKKLFEQDQNRLQAQMEKILQAGQESTRPRRLARPAGFWQQVTTGLIDSQTEAILAQGTSVFQRTDEFLAEHMPSARPLLSLFVADSDYGLPQAFGLTRLARQLKERKVWLAGGGFILIEPLETLTVIDVNSGRDLAGKSKRELIWRVNVQAAETIARQLRLRHVTGMILIDFIDLDREDLEPLRRVFTAFCRRDRAAYRQHGFSKMGLYELVRFFP